MTGIFVRIKREGPEGPSKPVDLDEMTNAELDSLDAVMAQREAWMTWTWVKALARYIRDQRTEGEPYLLSIVLALGEWAAADEQDEATLESVCAKALRVVEMTRQRAGP